MRDTSLSSQELRIVMVDTQVRPLGVTGRALIGALLSVAREAYVPPDKTAIAYADTSIALGADTSREMMAVSTLARMLDALELRQGQLGLVVGCGRGYCAAVLSQILDAVVGVDENAQWVADAEAALNGQGIYNVGVLNAPLVHGAPEAGPYDAIVIEGGVAQVPQTVTDQLKDGGRIVAIFRNGALGEARVGHKSAGRVHWRGIFNACAPILPGFATTPEFAL